ncbi:MAG: 3-oxoacyl-(Acyl-carrier-protein) reductase [Candidatus Giovannonibacteria bacterium GW2011_GWB1_45_9b]|uniref:3-oxoacyl-(Acyl-carrier-protein) reductase n=2 Tax=Candidatus Giovannoniibacteriota TaxID=1752738 RepID=A0A0G1N8C4_9BACT|nr:MAG: 3-oxoacyl-(Acyl-carrier-protein) reductase [Candidatus Giovannonibacteria bacterium GW2011_GWB1_45_9b]
MIMKKLEKKIILITGANSGIGRATAVLAAKEGANVIVNYLKNEKEAEKVVKELQDIGSDAVAIEADVSNYDEVLKMSLIVKEKYGKINGIVNNASASLDYKRFVDSDWNDFKKHIEVQIHGAFNVVKAFLPLFANGEAGSIVNIASRVTLGSSAAGISGYATAKYGLIGLTNALANELEKRRIRVNAVSPSFVETGLTKNLPRIYKEISANGSLGIKPGDVAEEVINLLSSDAADLNGINLPV